VSDGIAAPAPTLETSVGRVIDSAFFPTSPAATLREAIFSEILAGVLQAEPSIKSLDEFYEAASEMSTFDDEAVFEQARDVFNATYTATGSRGARGKKAKRYAVPFHPAIAKCIKPEETRNWGKWYRMHMTDGDGEFNHDLHREFVDRLESQDASNLFEQVFVDVAEDLATESESDEAPSPIRPYVPGCSRAFQADLAAWLEDDYDSPSNWLQSTRDLFCFHFMMYFIQLALNLRREFNHVLETGEPYRPEVLEAYFGLWDERATHDRPFKRQWRERGRNGIEGDIYDSWGRLGVINVITETANDAGYGGAYSLSEAMADLPTRIQRRCAENIEANLAPEDRERNPTLPRAANRLTVAVRQNYEERSRSNQTPITMGINVVRQLGDGQGRKFWRTQRKIGPTLRLNRNALRFFARLFTLAEDDVHYEMFVEYLQQRGISLDTQSQNLALEELDEMGMIDRQSDSGGAVYVRSI